MTDIEKYTKRSGHTSFGFVCGKCGKNPLPAHFDFKLVKAKYIVCPYCSFPIPNKRVDQ